MLVRSLEAHGIATTSISLVREHTEKVKPPRALFVPFPYGHAFGRPNDPELQHRVLKAALALLEAPAGPVLSDFPDEAESGVEPPAPELVDIVVDRFLAQRRSWSLAIVSASTAISAQATMSVGK